MPRVSLGAHNIVVDRVEKTPVLLELNCRGYRNNYVNKLIDMSIR